MSGLSDDFYRQTTAFYQDGRTLDGPKPYYRTGGCGPWSYFGGGTFVRVLGLWGGRDARVCVFVCLFVCLFVCGRMVHRLVRDPFITVVFPPAMVASCLFSLAAPPHTDPTTQPSPQLTPHTPLSLSTCIGEAPPIWLEPCQVWEVRGAELTLSPVHKAREKTNNREDGGWHGGAGGDARPCIENARLSPSNENAPSFPPLHLTP